VHAYKFLGSVRVGLSLLHWRELLKLLENLFLSLEERRRKKEDWFKRVVVLYAC
jgi:hypothetical protein